MALKHHVVTCGRWLSCRHPEGCSEKPPQLLGSTRWTRAHANASLTQGPRSQADAIALELAARAQAYEALAEGTEDRAQAGLEGGGHKQVSQGTGGVTLTPLLRREKSGLGQSVTGTRVGSPGL